VKVACSIRSDTVCDIPPPKPEEFASIRDQAKRLFEEGCNNTNTCDSFNKTTIKIVLPKSQPIQESLCQIAEKMAVKCWRLFVVEGRRRRQLRQMRRLDTSEVKVAVLPEPEGLPDGLKGDAKIDPAQAIKNIVKAVQDSDESADLPIAQLSIPVDSTIRTTDPTIAAAPIQNAKCATMDRCGSCGVGCNRHGTCDTGNNYTSDRDNTCVCNFGYGGDFCETELPMCHPERKSCQNGGTCAVVNQQETCRCTDQFTGDNCQTPKETGISTGVIALCAVGGAALLGLVTYVLYSVRGRAVPPPAPDKMPDKMPEMIDGVDHQNEKI
jgi:hypothetical protein